MAQLQTQAGASGDIVPESLLRPVVAYFHPVKVILFGSQARGQAGEDSDYDLFVVVDDDTPPEKLSWRGKYEARKDYHRAVDIVTCRQSVFERKRGIVGSLSHTADCEGMVVYECYEGILCVSDNLIRADKGTPVSASIQDRVPVAYSDLP